MSEWNASLQEIEQIKILLRVTKGQGDSDKRTENAISSLSEDLGIQRRDIFLLQIVAREQYSRLLGKLAHLKSTPGADMTAVHSIFEELLAAKLAYRATYELKVLLRSQQ